MGGASDPLAKALFVMTALVGCGGAGTKLGQSQTSLASADDGVEQSKYLSSAEDPALRALGPLAERTQYLRRCVDAHVGTLGFRYAGFNQQGRVASWCAGCEKATGARTRVRVYENGFGWESWPERGDYHVSVEFGDDKDFVSVEDDVPPRESISFGRCSVYVQPVEVVDLEYPELDLERLFASPEGIVAEWDACNQRVLAKALEKLERDELRNASLEGCEVMYEPLSDDQRATMGESLRASVAKTREWIVVHSSDIHRLLTTFGLHRCEVVMTEVEPPPRPRPRALKRPEERKPALRDEARAREILEETKKLLRASDFEAAADWLGDIIHCNPCERPTRARAWLYWGLAELELGEDTSARHAFSSALHLDRGVEIDERYFSKPTRDAWHTAREKSLRRLAEFDQKKQKRLEERKQKQAERKER